MQTYIPIQSLIDRSQIENADVLLLNKADLLEENDLVKVEETMKELAPHATVQKFPLSPSLILLRYIDLLTRAFPYPSCLTWKTSLRI